MHHLSRRTVQRYKDFSLVVTFDLGGLGGNWLLLELVAFWGVLVTFLVGSFEGFVAFSVKFVSRMAEFAGDVALVSALACLFIYFILFKFFLNKTKGFSQGLFKYLVIKFSLMINRRNLRV